MDVRRRAALPRRGGGAALGARPDAGRLPGHRGRQRLHRRLGGRRPALGATVVDEPRRGFGAACTPGCSPHPADVVCFSTRDGSLDPAELPPVAEPVLARRGRPGARPAPPDGRGAWPAHARAGQRACSPRGCAAAPAPRLHDLGPMRAARRDDLLALGLTRPAVRLPAGDGGARGRGRLADRRDRRRLPAAHGGTRSKVTGTVRGTARAVRDMAAVLARVTATGDPASSGQGAGAGPGQDPALPAVHARAGGARWPPPRCADTLRRRRRDAGRRARPRRSTGPVPGAARLSTVAAARRTASASAWPPRSPTPRPTGAGLLIGMDTPQVTAGLLAAPPPPGRPARRGARPRRRRRLVGARACATRTRRRAARRADVHTGHRRRHRAPRCAAAACGSRTLPRLRDVDTAPDAVAVAAAVARAPASPVAVAAHVPVAGGHDGRTAGHVRGGPARGRRRSGRRRSRAVGGPEGARPLDATGWCGPSCPGRRRPRSPAAPARRSTSAAGRAGCGAARRARTRGLGIDVSADGRTPGPPPRR